MEVVFVFLLLCISAFFVGKWSYDFLWFKASSLFDSGYRLGSKSNTSLHRSADDSNVFFSRFYSEYSIKSQNVTKCLRFLFAFGITCYVITIEIVLWQIKTADRQQEPDFITRYVWPLASVSLTILLIVLQPFFILLSLLNKFFNDRFDMVHLFIVTAVTLFLLVTTLNYMTWGPFYFGKSILTKLSIAGVTIMATLSGIASISTIYYTFSLLFRRGSKVTGFPANNLVSRNRKLNIWTTKRQLQNQIDNLELNIAENISILQRMDEEVVGANSPLRKEMVEKISWYQLEVAKLEKSLSQPPILRNSRRLFETAFLIYCCHKILITFLRRIPRIISHSMNYPDDIDYMFFYESGDSTSSSSDPLAVTLAKILDLLLFRFNYQHDLDSLTKQISLLISISLFICTLSTVNTTITYLLSLLPPRLQIIAMVVMQNNENQDILPTSKQRYSTRSPSLIKNLIISELIGVYVVSTVLLIRSNLPYDTAMTLKELLGEKFTVPTGAIDSWFDKVYALVCILTIIGINVAEKSVILLKKSLSNANLGS
ncbi:hypothetical protein RNJ44_02656 [Nakaseomyces bracarensis]|uniref:Golgi pH regulator n=1 Tax=Nakaseomyces bracarensis TaxID=273131 RepID=A0ABR4NZV8_9SACH